MGLRMQPSCPRAGKGGVSLLLLLGGASPSAPPTALPQDLVCTQPRGFGGGPVLIGHCQARLSPLLQLLLPWLQAGPLCPSFTPIGPAGTWAPQLSPGPHCSPDGARPSVPPQCGTGSVPGSLDPCDESLDSPGSALRLLGQLHNLHRRPPPPNYAPYIVWQPGENSRALCVLVQICWVLFGCRERRVP